MGIIGVGNVVAVLFVLPWRFDVFHLTENRSTLRVIPHVLRVTADPARFLFTRKLYPSIIHAPVLLDHSLPPVHIT